MCGQIPRSSVYDSRNDGANTGGDGDGMLTASRGDLGTLQTHASSLATGQATYDEDLVAIHDMLGGKAESVGARTSTNSNGGNQCKESAIVPVLLPMPIVALRGVTVRSIACGQDCFGAVTDGKHCHQLYTWGRLQARSPVVAQPKLVMVPSRDQQPTSAQTPLMRPLRNVSMLAIGMEHIVALTMCSSGGDCGNRRLGRDRVQLWTWGSGTQGQLGHGDTMASSLPREVLEISAQVHMHGDIMSIAAGNEHTVVMFTDGSLCAFGCGFFGRLGLGTEENWTTPRFLEPFSHS